MNKLKDQPVSLHGPAARTLTIRAWALVAVTSKAQSLVPSKPIKETSNSEKPREVIFKKSHWEVEHRNPVGASYPKPIFWDSDMKFSLEGKKHV